MPIKYKRVAKIRSEKQTPGLNLYRDHALLRELHKKNLNNVAPASPIGLEICMNVRLSKV